MNGRGLITCIAFGWIVLLAVDIIVAAGYAPVDRVIVGINGLFLALVLLWGIYTGPRPKGGG